MPSQSTRSTRSLATVALSFSRDEWELLTGLPRRILIAATSTEADGAGSTAEPFAVTEPDRQSVAEGLAGIAALAAGRASPSPLVREVVAAIYAERGPAGPGTEEHQDHRAGVHATLWAAQRASELVASKVPAPDAAAYREWLTQVARAVCVAARSGGWFGLGVRRGPAETRFLDELQAVLGT